MRILTLDGGGIRGLLTAALIARLSREQPGWLAQADILAGTSTGGILALAIAVGLDDASLIGLYRDQGPVIFQQSWADRLSRFDELVSPDFDATHLRGVLNSVFGDRRMGDLPRRVLVTTYDLQREKFKVIDSRCPRDRDLKVADVAQCTSAAPTYFQSHDGCIDGGVTANNPAMVAIAQALEDGGTIQTIQALSIGTGRAPPRPYPFTFTPDGRPEPLRWGLAKWAPRLITLLFDGGLDEVDFYAKKLLGARFHRLNPPLTAPIDLADVSAIPALLNAADIADIDPTLAWLRARWVLTPTA